jgi:hypothetical protein
MSLSIENDIPNENDTPNRLNELADATYFMNNIDLVTSRMCEECKIPLKGIKFVEKFNTTKGLIDFHGKIKTEIIERAKSRTCNIKIEWETPQDIKFEYEPLEKFFERYNKQISVPDTGERRASRSNRKNVHAFTIPNAEDAEKFNDFLICLRESEL